MEVKAQTANILELELDAITLGTFEDDKRFSGALAEADRRLNGGISQLKEAGEIKGKLGEVTVIHTLGQMKPRRIVVVGLGKQKGFDAERARRALGSACKAMNKANVKQAATSLLGAEAGIEPRKLAQALTEAALLATYRYTKKRDEDEKPTLEELSIVDADQRRLNAMQWGIERGTILANATNFARDLVNAPPEEMTPAQMAERAQALAEKRGLECDVFGVDRIREMGMGALWGVAKGSEEPPRFVIVRYQGGGRKSIGIVGKGVCFDSGGLSLKTAEQMVDMKSDMSGAAAVIAAMDAIAQLQPKVNVTALAPLVENLPSGKAFKPGDILKALNGKTIEILNTDAEGRLILADALSYARQLGLSPVIDLATLTGACVVALGPICTGAFANEPAVKQGVVDKVIAAGKEAGEHIWQMPLFEDYKELIKSDFADMKNTGGRAGGAITAAWLLAEFIEDTPWVHLDIAPTAWTEKEQPYQPKGATGVGVRTVVNFILGESGAGAKR